MKHGIYDSTAPYPRDLVGYGADVPHARWPGGARIALPMPAGHAQPALPHPIRPPIG